MAQAPTILLVNHWHDDNKGDSAITGGILALVRERWPDARVRVATLHEPGSQGFATQTRHVERSYGVTGEAALSPTEVWSGRQGKPGALARWLGRMLVPALEVATGRVRRGTRARLRGVDLVIMVGGSNVYDDPDVRAPVSLARLLMVLYPAWAAGRVGVPVVMAGHTLGPFPRRAGVALARRMLRGVRRVALREATSVEVAQRLGLGAVAAVRPDMAFATAAQRGERVAALLDDGPTVALVLRSHPHAGEAADVRVAEAVAAVGRQLVADGRARTLLVMAHTLGPTAVEDDRPAARRLAALLQDAGGAGADGARVRLVEDDLSAEELAALYGGCALVVSVRLHAAILALAHGTPAFAIAYMTRKTEGVMEQAGLADAWSPYEDATVQRILPAARALLDGDARARLERARASWLADLRAERDAWPLS